MGCEPVLVQIPPVQIDSKIAIRTQNSHLKLNERPLHLVECLRQLKSWSPFDWLSDRQRIKIH